MVCRASHLSASALYSHLVAAAFPGYKPYQLSARSQFICKHHEVGSCGLLGCCGLTVCSHDDGFPCLKQGCCLYCPAAPEVPGKAGKATEAAEESEEDEAAGMA